VSSPNHASILRYFERADSFIEVRRLAEGVCIPGDRALDREGYERLVVRLCLGGVDAGMLDELEQLFPEEIEEVAHDLYELCVDVNPGLDIKRVGLDAGGLREEKAEPRTRAQPVDHDSFLAGLARRSHGLAERLGERVVGQASAVERITRSVRKAAAGLNHEDRPLASLLFTGRTGTGKTLLARTLAKELFGGESGSPATGMLRIDCSEFALPHEYAKLIGAPPGYVGHEGGGRLTEALRGGGPMVVLFDEIEKADGKLHDLLLQVLEEGALTDGRGETVRFDRTLVILTSNAGAREMVAAERRMGFEASAPLATRDLESITHEALGETFSPEFLGRLDEVVVFESLDLEGATEIARRELTELAARARRSGDRVVAFTPALARWVAERGFCADSGAREVRRVIQRSIEAPLAEALLDPRLPAGALVRGRVRDGQPCFQIEA